MRRFVASVRVRVTASLSFHSVLPQMYGDTLCEFCLLFCLFVLFVLPGQAVLALSL